MNQATAVLVTRGDVDLTEIRHSLDACESIDEIVIWDNANGMSRWSDGEQTAFRAAEDLAVYGRYAGIAWATNPLIYVQDDDCLHQPEGITKIIETWDARDANDPTALLCVHVDDMLAVSNGEHVVCNMPANFRHSFYQKHALVGFGACFHRDAPARAFGRAKLTWREGDSWPPTDLTQLVSPSFNRTCDIVFTALTPRVLVDVAYQDMPWASAENRMWKQGDHREERGRMLDLVLEVRDA